MLDNGFVQYLYHGGFVAVAMYSALLLWLGWKGWHLYRVNGRRYIILPLMVVLILGLSIGAPAFTLNRFSVNITMFICLVLLMRRGE
ncbi:MAG: hypothetical protein U5K31_02590 [Balneolaceae bacterium]|nr:hypothetical protein [Balneolaceae bacterium]